MAEILVYDRALPTTEIETVEKYLGQKWGIAISHDNTPPTSGNPPTFTVTPANDSVTTAHLTEQILKYLKPEITTQPQAPNVFPDTNASFSVTAEGKYLAYQWKKNGADLVGETNATLNITDANATLHDGNYSVVVSNDFGSVESSANTLSVLNTEMTGLVGWWPFDGNASDMSGNSNHGTVSGATLTNDRHGRSNHAYSFNGTNGFIQVAHHSSLSLASYSISVWHKPTVGGTRSIIMKDNHPSENYSLWVTGFTQFKPNNAPSMVQAYGEAIQLNQYYHYAVTKSASALKIFINGSLDAQTTSMAIPSLNSQPLYFGHDGGFGYGKFQGTMDDIRIYDRPLSTAEVEALYNLGQ